MRRGERVESTRRSFMWSVVACGVLLSARATSQQTDRMPRVALVFGVVPLAEMAGVDPPHPFARAFVHALRDVGLVEGRNIVIERRSAEGRGIERMTALIQEVVSLDVDVIVTTARGWASLRMLPTASRSSA